MANGKRSYEIGSCQQVFDHEEAEFNISPIRHKPLENREVMTHAQLVFGRTFGRYFLVANFKQSISKSCGVLRSGKEKHVTTGILTSPGSHVHLLT